MVNLCCVIGCKNESYPGSIFSFHRFPKNETKNNEWQRVVPAKINKTSVICSAHFKSEEFVRHGSRKFLNPDAVPSIFPKDIPLTEMLNVKIDGRIDLSQNFNLKKNNCEKVAFRANDEDSDELDDTTPRLIHNKNHKITSKIISEARKREIENAKWLPKFRATENFDEYETVTETYVKVIRKKKKTSKPFEFVMAKKVKTPEIMAMRYSSPPTDLIDILANLGKGLTQAMAIHHHHRYKSATESALENVTPQRKAEIKKPSILSRPHFVKEDLRLQNFSFHIYKRSMEVFESMKTKTDDQKIKSKLDFVARSYREKFAEFVNDTLNQKIITKLGTQKVVLNTIDTSNRIMRRLLTYLVADMENAGSLRNNLGFAHSLRNGVSNEEQQEYVHACLTFNVCRSKKTFSGFLVDLLSCVLQADDKKLKQAADALTEVIKYEDLSGYDNPKTLLRSLKKKIDVVERMDASELRPYIWMLRNLIASKNKPLIVHNTIDGNVVNRSVAIVDLVDIFDDRIPANEENMLDWNDIKESMSQWAEGTRKDIMDIMKRFSWQIINKGVARMNSKYVRQVHNKLKNVLL